MLLTAVQVILLAGLFPPPRDNGVTYLRIPLNTV